MLSAKHEGVSLLEGRLEKPLNPRLAVLLLGGRLTLRSLQVNHLLQIGGARRALAAV